MTEKEVNLVDEIPPLAILHRYLGAMLEEQKLIRQELDRLHADAVWMAQELQRLQIDYCHNGINKTCGSHDAECPIQMGEWWTPEERKRFDKIKAMLDGQ